jgi:hypothetical protein
MDKIKLYHYSNTDIKGYLKPDYFGDNFYTGNSQRISNIKRLFFYTSTDRRESIFNSSKYLYTASINESKLYDLTTDKLNLAGNIKGDIYAYFKGLGYTGLIGSIGFTVICLFNKIKIDEKITL